MTAPRWITDALAAACCSIGRMADVEPDVLARELIERLPIERMIDAIAVLPSTRDAAAEVVSRIVEVLSGDPEVVTLTQLYQDATRALDVAGAPYAEELQGQHDAYIVQLDLAGRIRWLSRLLTDTVTKLDVERDEREADRVAGVAASDADAARIADLEARAKLAELVRDTARGERDAVLDRFTELLRFREGDRIAMDAAAAQIAAVRKQMELTEQARTTAYDLLVKDRDYWKSLADARAAALSGSGS